MRSRPYRGYRIEVCTHGGYQIYFHDDEPCLFKAVDTVKEARAKIDAWIAAYEREHESDESGAL